MATTAKKAPVRKIEDKRLKAYLDATKNDSILLGAVDRHLQLVHDDRDATVIHPSEMSSRGWCARATWHRLMGHPLLKPEPLTLRPNLIFEEGREIHKKWQRWLTDMGIIWGRWVCVICETEVYAWASDLEPGSCPAHGGRHYWEYKEVPLEDPTCRIGGHADGIVRPGGESILLEVKSIGPGTMRKLDLLAEHESDDISSDRFSKISRPARAHLLQTQMYLRLAEQWESVVGKVQRAVVIYEHKSDQQIREFVVTRNDRWIEPLLSTAADIVWAINRERNVPCPHGGCPKCKAYEEN